jgi:hypothetical protein
MNKIMSNKFKTMSSVSCRFICFLATILLLGFNSCISEGINNFNIGSYSDKKSIVLRIGSGIGTRAESASVPDGTPVTFNTGNLYLVSADGVIVRHFTISSNATDIDTGGSNIQASALYTGTGVYIENVPGNITRIVIAGNTVGNATNGAIAPVGARLIDVIRQYNVENVNLWGSGNLELRGIVAGRRIYHIAESPGLGNSFRLYPTLARMEISQFQGMGMISNFRINGIFIDQFYRQASVAGTPYLPSLQASGNDAALFLPGSTAYPNTAPNSFTPAVFDWYEPGLRGYSGNNLIVTPQTNNAVWSYNLFAVNRAACATGTRLPSIVVRLSDIELIDGSIIPGDRFLTIQGFRHVTTLPTLGVVAGDWATGLHASHIYRILNVVFDETDLTEKPNEDPINVSVTVNVISWGKIQAGIPGFLQPTLMSAAIGCHSSHTFYVGVAVTGSCTAGGAITYLWEHSFDNDFWEPAPGINSNPTFTTPIMNRHMFYRRRATCACGNFITTNIATVSMHYHIRDYTGIYYRVVTPGLQWATRNVDLSTSTGFADHPIDAGMFFQWNRNVGWSVTGTLRRWCRTANDWEDAPWDGTEAPGTAWYDENNPCPDGWRLPTEQELRDLMAIGSVWLDEDAAAVAGFGCQTGRLFGIDTYPNQIFLPAVGWRNIDDGTLVDVNRDGTYWSSSTCAGLSWCTGCACHGPGTGAHGRSMGFGHWQDENTGIWHTYHDIWSCHRADVHTVRCVRPIPGSNPPSGSNLGVSTTPF